MSETENIHVGYISEYQRNKTTISVLGKDYHVSPTKEESRFLEDIMYDAQLNYIIFDIANQRIITYDILQPVGDREIAKNMYIAFVRVFTG